MPKEAEPPTRLADFTVSNSPYPRNNVEQFHLRYVKEVSDVHKLA